MIKRKFIYPTFKGVIELDDPGSKYTEEQVRAIHANDYPELLNAAIIYHEVKDGVQELEFDAKTETAEAAKAPTGQPVTSPGSASTKTVEYKTSVGKRA